MNPVKRALVPMLIAALVVPTAASAQEPSRPFDATPGTDAGAGQEVRLIFGGQRAANPWAVFGGGPAVAGHAQPAGRVSREPDNGSRTLRPRLPGIEASALEAGRAAARRQAGFQSQSWNDWWANRPGLLLIAIVAGVIVLLATSHADEIPWLSGR
jgi:hypothetical protein